MMDCLELKPWIWPGLSGGQLITTPTPRIEALDLLTPVTEHIELWDLFTDVSMTVLPIAAKLGISIDIRIDDDLSSMVGDALQLQTALVVLLKNAVELSIEGTRVKVGAKRLTDAIRFTISNCFIGKRDNEFGFSVAREIFEAHGGVLSTISIPGQGTTIMVDLPDTSYDDLI